jgi:hypothetical protein
MPHLLFKIALFIASLGFLFTGANRATFRFALCVLASRRTLMLSISSVNQKREGGGFRGLAGGLTTKLAVHLDV